MLEPMSSDTTSFVMRLKPKNACASIIKQQAGVFPTARCLYDFALPDIRNAALLIFIVAKQGYTSIIEYKARVITTTCDLHNSTMSKLRNLTFSVIILSKDKSMTISEINTRYSASTYYVVFHFLFSNQIKY
eukprot:Mrub_07275.p3 GENE.Mrub_07275~~Mrub_07275.p3  ORF type:complete len:132 (+),score=14.29 Mrub_07275:475-870(+)